MSASKYPSPLTLRLAPEKWAALRRDAESSGLSTSEYVRVRLFDGSIPVKRKRQVRPIKDYESLARALGLLSKSHIAGNLNQIAKAVNTGYLEMTPEVTSAIIEACSHTEQRKVKSSMLSKLNATSPQSLAATSGANERNEKPTRHRDMHGKSSQASTTSTNSSTSA